MDGKGKILIVDDNEDVLLSLNMLLKSRCEAIRVISRPERIGEFMDAFHPDVIILDMNFTRDAISGEEGYRWLDFILKKDPKAVVLFITAYVDTEKAVRAIKAGAVDFIPKPWDKHKLLGIVESAVELSHSRKTGSDGESAGNADSSDGPVMIGESEAMLTLRRQIMRIASTDANVLVTGENGTGKDVVARLLHHHSRRYGAPFVAIDLGTVPEQLFESELFGYEKGAFTDAKAAKPGRIETADKGTVFLDEIGNLNLQAQQKMLTLIEKRTVSRLGTTKVRNVDVRIIAATNADLGRMVADGSFRQDLLYRINTIELHIPPLRERRDDIILLADYFTGKIAERYRLDKPRLSASARDKLMHHSWPGNVRELQHVMERAIVLATGSELTADDVAVAKSQQAAAMETLNLEALEREAIMRAISRSAGNLSQAAELLGISRYALYRKIEKYGL
ncbi:MAG: sigma-54 dependent transcriptional regulator [Muribaculaceae bacterium]|nr:sigma-54 dependent transcriptional regulator [Muribaculaceae bacterium]